MGGWTDECDGHNSNQKRNLCLPQFGTKVRSDLSRLWSLTHDRAERSSDQNQLAYQELTTEHGLNIIIA